ncbi:PRD domain-containing protein [Fodinisporobacter ferrooxydans]|uniref:PRD domain-containing protein n=1 Tax=Fodinisporobacter ferrooxydans TaxID=2901836 RepID=A0ABY4CH54_9BACL|nr:PRD domain-containing protein [Alicyclobacillaceae bacterium MYW30-H2]
MDIRIFQTTREASVYSAAILEQTIKNHRNPVLGLATGSTPIPLVDTIHAALIDHVNFAIERHKKGINLSNPFTYEIKHLYPDDYNISEQAVQYINDKLGVDLPEEEVAFLATHFHSARTFTKSSDTLGVARLVSTIAKARSIADDLSERLGTTVPDEEVGFLTLHLERLSFEK